MKEQPQVIEYKCPCCNSGLIFDDRSQKLSCNFCGNTFDLDVVIAYHNSQTQGQTEEFHWENSTQQEWDKDAKESIRTYQCPSCGGEILTEATTAATFCPYCDNPTILPAQLSGGLRPDAIIPFHTSKEHAKAAFLKLCKTKPLLPKGFTQEQRLERISGIYVPFWLYDCHAEFDGNYQAVHITHWSDFKYNYTKMDHYLLQRAGDAKFIGIPMDGSSKMDDSFMESIEPYDYSQTVDFDMAYLTGYLADKYDVPAENGETRIQERINKTIQDKLQESVKLYHIKSKSQNLQINNDSSRYVLLPVWILNTRYHDKIYTFAMNGQTGKMTGTFPISKSRTAAWFAGIFTSVTLLSMLIQQLMH